LGLKRSRKSPNLRTHRWKYQKRTGRVRVE
jgi:hypothetical protein